jgi:hypothetical protein
MDDVVLRLGGRETAVVGYGLLLSRDTVDKTLRRRYEGPFVRCRLAGWRRTWNASMPNAAFYLEEGSGRVYPARILYLNAHRDREASINCSVFVVDNDDLEALDSREWIYDRVPVTEGLRGLRLEGGEAVIYTCKQEHLVEPGTDPGELAVRQSFLWLLEGVLDGVDPDVRSEFLSTTDPVPEHLVVGDKLDPERSDPWQAAGRAFKPEVPTEPSTAKDAPHRS